MYTPSIQRVYREQEEQAEGVVIAIDVIRAFTVAACAFAGGATGLWLVRTIEEALALRERDPLALLAGEVNGRLIPGFDLNNSPLKMTQADVRGRRIIQRTGAGTQGAVSAHNARHVLICSFTNAHATAHYAAHLSALHDLPITLLPTATHSETFTRNEDDYCADYLEALLTHAETAHEIPMNSIERLFAEDRFAHWGGGKDEDFPEGDLDLIVAVDRFNFAMVGEVVQYNHKSAQPSTIHYVNVHAVHLDELSETRA